VDDPLLCHNASYPFLLDDDRTDYISGQVLARMASGKLGLVPTSTQTGDTIFYMNKARQSPKQFLPKTVGSI